MKKLAIFFLSFFITFSLRAEARNALLIANGDYKNFGKLAAPLNEAKELKKTLEKLGFSVTLVQNGSRENMLDSLYDFQTKLEKSGGIAFFHYGGHAVQVNGKNYLIPVDADIPDERRVSIRAVDVDEVMLSMQADTNIVVLDACRNNPLPASSVRSATRGLALVTEKPKNSIIVYSAEPGKVAQDGVFTPILTQKLLEQKEFYEIIRDVRKEVIEKTNGTQNPGAYDQLTGKIYLAGLNPSSETQISKTATNQTLQTATVSTKSTATTIADGFVFVAGGTFSMGSTSDDSDEKPVHKVTVSDFYISDYEVTQAEYKAVMGTNPSYFSGDDKPVEQVSWYDAIEYCNKLSEMKGLTPCYSKNGNTYTCDWNANGYRLPTEAEWEYAARGGNESKGYTYSGSNDIGHVAWYWNNRSSGTQTVKTKQPNELGLYDMSGNVWEWCWDCYGNYSSSAQTNPTGASSGSFRVFRGGCWCSVASDCRVAYRSRSSPGYANGNLGFRVVRSSSK